MLQLNQQCVLLDMQAISKESALKEMAQMAVDNYHYLDSSNLYSILLEREQIGSTGVGNGVAIPHGKVKGLKEIIFCFGRSLQGVSFDAIDNRPVHLFALLLSPTNIASEYLQALAHVSTVLKQQTNRIKLLQSSSTQEIVTIFTPLLKRNNTIISPAASSRHHVVTSGRAAISKDGIIYSYFADSIKKALQIKQTCRAK